MAITILRQDQATISISLPSNPAIQKGLMLNIRSWAMLEGGDLESEDTKTRPGGMVGQVNLGGPTTRSDATVSRPYTPTIHPYIKRLEDIAGSAEMKIHWTILDAKGHTTGGPTYTLDGILKGVTRPNWDANTAGAASLALVMGCNVEASV